MLIAAPPERKVVLFHPHQQGDRDVDTTIRDALPGFQPRTTAISDEQDPVSPPQPYAFRSFDRQWIIPDKRLINRPNPELWAVRSNRQVFLTAPSDRSPSSGPALTFTALIPDLHHYNGRGGRVFPLWSDRDSRRPNLLPTLLPHLGQRYDGAVAPDDVFAYIAGTAAHPAFTARFEDDLSTPGLRIPLTADRALFREVADLGRLVIWLHTFGERMVDASAGRPAGPPRLPEDRRPFVPLEGAIPSEPSLMPETIDYDAARNRLLVGAGYVENVPPEVWDYEVSGKHVLRQWFSYRERNRERPIIGTRRPPSPLSAVQPDHWLPEYTTELLNVLNVLGWLVELEPAQADLLERVCSGPLISTEQLKAAGVQKPLTPRRRRSRAQEQPELL